MLISGPSLAAGASSAIIGNSAPLMSLKYRARSWAALVFYFLGVLGEHQGVGRFAMVGQGQERRGVARGPQRIRPLPGHVRPIDGRLPVDGDGAGVVETVVVALLVFDIQKHVARALQNVPLELEPVGDGNGVGGLCHGGMFAVEIALVVFQDLAHLPGPPRGFGGVVRAMLDNRQLIGRKMVAQIEAAQPVRVRREDHVGIGQQSEIAGILVSRGDGMPRIEGQRFHDVDRLAANAYLQSFGSRREQVLGAESGQQAKEEATTAEGLHHRLLRIMVSARSFPVSMRRP